MTTSRLPHWHGNRRLADLSTDGPYQHCAEPIRLATRWVERVRSDNPPSKGLYFHGGIGSGKTSIAAAIAVELGCAYWDMREFIARCKEEMRVHVRDSAVDLAVRAPVLILDDVGKQRATPYVIETTQDIIERRFDRGHLTCVTSNLGPGEMSAYLEPACWSRLDAATVAVPVEGADLRRRVA